MTGQISDGFRYQEHEFAISGISDHKNWFKPSRMRLKPDSPTTACWRGYVAHFALADAHLILDQLHICLVGKDYAPRTGPIVNGVKPKGPSADHDWFNNHYLDLGYPLKYTGRLLLGTGFIQALYVHMGDQLPWKYEKVHELVFKDGLLIEAYDRSDQMVAIRQRNIQIEAENDDPGRVHRWPDFTIGG